MDPPHHVAAAPAVPRRLVLGAWLLLAAATTLPYAAAALEPPRGHVFSGAVFYPDDFFQYASFAEQAGRGRFLFANKFDPEPHRPVLVNVEWWAAGLLSALFGGRPGLGFGVLRVAAIGALIAAAARLLQAAGLRGAQLGWGLALVATGGGLGWLRFLLWRAPGAWMPDLQLGLYPWHQAVSNAHFVFAAALLLWAVHLHLRFRQGLAPRWAWLAVAWVLGFSRPYDLAALVAVVAGLAAWDFARTRRLAALRPAADLAWLAPVAGYYAIVVGGHPSFGGWGTQAGDLSPPRLAYLWAFGPAAALALLAGRRGAPPSAEAAELRRAFICWCAGLALLLVLWTAPMAKQCLTSFGMGLLLWAAAVTPRRFLAPAVLALSLTSWLVLWLAFQPGPASFVARESLAAAEWLRPACAPGDVAIAPTDLSLAIAALTPCHVALGHRLLTPRFDEAVAEGSRFYDAATPAEWRLAYLARRHAAFVALPFGRGGWLGPAPPWKRVFAGATLELWQRRPTAPQPPDGPRP